MSKPKLILIGGGGHCRTCIDVIGQEDRFSIAGIVDVLEKKQLNVLGVFHERRRRRFSGIDQDFPQCTDYARQIKSPIRRMELFNDLIQMCVL